MNVSVSEASGLSKKPPSATSKGKETATAKKTPSATPSSMQNKKLDKISESDLQSAILAAEEEEVESKKPFDPYEDRFDDLTLRCVLYACLFQIQIDRQDFDEALEQMELALNELPRTKHRLLIYRIKVITKSKLGLDVQMDLQKVIFTFLINISN